MSKRERDGAFDLYRGKACSMVNAVEQNMRMREIAKQWRCIYGRSTNSSISSIILLLISSLFALRRDYWSCLKNYFSMKVQCRRGIVVRNYATRFCFTLSTAKDTVKNIRKFIHKRNAAVKISFSNRWVRKSEIKIRYMPRDCSRDPPTIM